jgi:hypothetical protein
MARWIGLALLLGPASAACRDGSSAAGPAACTQPGCVETIYDRGSDQRRQPQRGIRVDATDVFWSEVDGDEQFHISGMKVYAAPKNGGGPIRALGDWADYQYGASLVLDASRVYWLANGKVASVRKDGSGRTDLAIPSADKIDLGPILDADGSVLVGSHGCFFLARIPKDGSPAQVWPVTKRTVSGGSTGLEVDGPIYYCANGHYLNALDTRTGQATEILAYDGDAGSLRKVGQDLYWADSGTAQTKGPVLQVLAAGATQPKVAGRAYGAAGSLMFDPVRMRLYWITGLATTGCDAVAYDFRSQQSSFLARNLNEMGDNAMDDDHVYWLASTAVMRVHK